MGRSLGLAAETKAATGTLVQSPVRDSSLSPSPPRVGKSKTLARRDLDA